MTFDKNSLGHAREDVASVQKSVVSMLVGIAQQKKLIRLSDPASIHLKEGWSSAKPDQEKQITVKHLITMSSGLNDRLRYVAPPNTRWKYNTNAYSRSLTIVTNASKKSANEVTAEWLTKRIGMQEEKNTLKSF